MFVEHYLQNTDDKKTIFIFLGGPLTPPDPLPNDAPGDVQLLR